MEENDLYTFIIIYTTFIFGCLIFGIIFLLIQALRTTRACDICYKKNNYFNIKRITNKEYSKKYDYYKTIRVCKKCIKSNPIPDYNKKCDICCNFMHKKKELTIYSKSKYDGDCDYDLIIKVCNHCKKVHSIYNYDMADTIYDITNKIRKEIKKGL
jgi:hypothetical protein